MNTYRRVTLELGRYRHDWADLTVLDLATWLNNWRAEGLVDIYIAALAEKQITHPERERATKLARAAFVAMDGPTAKRLMMNPYCRIMIDLAIEARREDQEARRQAIEKLAQTLALLLPGSPYNSPGGPADGIYPG